MIQFNRNNIGDAIDEIEKQFKHSSSNRHDGKMRSNPSCYLYNAAGKHIDRYRYRSSYWKARLRAAMYKVGDGTLKFDGDNPALLTPFQSRYRRR